MTPELVDGSPTLRTADRIVKYLDIVHIDKFNNISYPRTADIIASRMGHTSLVNNADLLIDGTGIGEAVVDLLRDRHLAPLPIIFTGGEQVREVHEDMGHIFGSTFGGMRAVKEMHVPKADLVAAGQLLIQQGRVRVAPGLKYADDFKAQMEGFRGKVNERGRVKYENESDTLHDDMVVCYLMAAWWMVQGQGAAAIKEVAIRQEDTEPAWEPADGWNQ